MDHLGIYLVKLIIISFINHRNQDVDDNQMLIDDDCVSNTNGDINNQKFECMVSLCIKDEEDENFIY